MNCKGDEELGYDFQGSISIEGEDIIVLFFDEDTKSKVITYPSDIQYVSDTPSKNVAVKRNNNGKICNSKCVIIVAILVPITIISAIIAVICFRRKTMKKKKVVEEDSTVINLKNIL